MPSRNLYNKLLGAKDGAAISTGMARKMESDEIMEDTWWDDIAARTVYLYDWYHDDYKTTLNDLHPESDPKKIPLDIKYVAITSQTYSKDYVNYHLQMKPHQLCNVDYYDEFFAKRYGAEFPVGLFVDIPDSKGIFNRWMIVGMADYNSPQFPTYEILRCDKVIQYIVNNKKYQVASVLRSQNSYNSGVWTD